MKKQNTWAGGLLKTLAFLLAVVTLLTFLLSAGAVIACAALGAYTKDNGKLVSDYMEDMTMSLARDMANYYAQELHAPEKNYYYTEGWNFYFNSEYTNYRFSIYRQSNQELSTASGLRLTSNYENQPVLFRFVTEVQPSYMTIEEKVDYHLNGDGSFHTSTSYEEVYHSLDTIWTVESYILKDTGFSDRFSVAYAVLTTLFRLKTTALWLMGASLLVFILTAVYLFCAAGHRPGKEEIVLNVFDKIPLELYLAVPVGLGVLLFWLLDELLRYWEHSLAGYEGALLIASLCGVCVLLAAVLLGCALSIAARLKKGCGYILRKTLVFWVLMIFRWCLKLVWRFIELCWRGVKAVARGMGRLLRMLPLIWQWLTIGVGLGLVFLLAVWGRSVLLLLLGLLLWAGLTVCYALSFGTLQKALHRMAQGHLDSRVDLRGLYGNFRLVAQDINALSAGAELEVERRMRSERMKTELITNVSHDIKTPLTSIVTYVDLLQKEHTPEEKAQYLEVLARQSQRLKKLTEDLVEMSKASSGNLAVELTNTSIVELINQAVAEYDEKMERAALKVVKKLPDVELYAKADGRLFWRVMDNILGNCVKYALPGTRVYVDVTGDKEHILVSVKNISKEPLEHSPEELMERFVRGDRSRNTEGSGLGLNIAASLMELQGGKLELGVDGDLFKAVLTLKTVDCAQ